MRIKYRDSHCYYTAKSYDSGKNVYEITAADGSTIQYYPKLRLDNEYDPKQYQFHLLSNSSPTCSENSIYQVLVGKQRIGWIFPFQALLSNEHDYVSNPYFLKYAYVATELLLQEIEQVDKQAEPSEFLLDDYYNCECNLLVLDTANTAKINGFKLKDYLVGLYKYGYSFSTKGNVLADLTTGEHRTTITLKPVSKELSGISTINDWFEKQLPFATDEVMQFHLTYQLIELLIEVIFEYKFNSLIAEITANPKKLSDHKDSLSSISNEKTRVKDLFEKYAPGTETSYKTDLDTACKNLLLAAGRAVSKQYYNNLYSVRCLVVHGLYSLPKEMFGMLNEINKPFLNIMMDVLFIFQKPPKP